MKKTINLESNIYERIIKDLVDDAITEEDPNFEKDWIEGTIVWNYFQIDWDRENDELIIDVVEYDIESLFNEYNISFEKSNVSNSVYFELNGRTYRVSDHERPNQDTVIVWATQYDNYIICNNGIEIYETVKRIIKENMI